MTMQDGIRAVKKAFTEAATPPRWPMYVRQAKQYLRSSVEGFDERKYGFASVVDLLRAAGKEGVLRIERDRQGAVRVFAGPNLSPTTVIAPPDVETVIAEPVSEAPIVEAEAVEPLQAVEAVEVEPVKKGARPRRPSTRKTSDTAKVAKVAKPRARKTSRTKSEAADVD